jgi:hypothetical protein
MNRDQRVNPAMRAAVEAAMAALGYRPHRAARALRSNRTYAIALLAGSQAAPPRRARRSSRYLGEVIAGCARACRPPASTSCSSCSPTATGARRRRRAAALLDDLAPRRRRAHPAAVRPALAARTARAARDPVRAAHARRRAGHGAVPSRSTTSPPPRALTERLLAAGTATSRSSPARPTTSPPAPAARLRGGAGRLRRRARARIGEGDFFLASGEREAARCSPAPTARPRCSPPTIRWPPARCAAAALGLVGPGDLARGRVRRFLHRRLHRADLRCASRPELARRAATR